MQGGVHGVEGGVGSCKNMQEDLRGCMVAPLHLLLELSSLRDKLIPLRLRRHGARLRLHCVGGAGGPSRLEARLKAVHMVMRRKGV